MQETSKANGDNKPAPKRAASANSKPNQNCMAGKSPGAKLFANLAETTEWKDLWVVEIFAGTARLSRAFTKRGFSCFIRGSHFKTVHGAYHHFGPHER